MNTLQLVILPTIDGGMRREDAARAKVYKEIRSRAHTSTSNNLSSIFASLNPLPPSRPSHTRSCIKHVQTEKLVEYAVKEVPAAISLIFRS